jgi:Spy/CpxP family protein refolding chaperone
MMNVQQRLQMMSDQLNLTDDQKAKLLPILQADADQRLAVHNDDSLSGDERHEKMREIGKATSKQMREVLTPDQWEKFKELRAAHASPPPPNSLPMGGSAPSADGPPPPSN